MKSEKEEGICRGVVWNPIVCWE